ncbi:MAG: hypothetical protein C0599_10870, partial [Salinivirgaceae bacterium]
MYHMNKFFLPLLLFISICLSGQINQYGIPILKNYTTKDYNAYSQNWAAIQDHNGIMYFANNNGVLQYDGVGWETTPINQIAIIKSFAIDSSGTLYVGADHEFGILEKNKKGKLVYTSLSNSLNSKDNEFKTIIRVYKSKDTVFYCGYKKLFLKTKDSIWSIKTSKGGFLSHRINNQFYMGDYFDGLMKFQNNKYDLLPNGDQFINMDLMSIIPINNKQLLIGSAKNGIFFYDLNTKNVIKPYSKQHKRLQELIKNGYLYNTIKNDQKLTFITLFNGAIKTNKELKLEELYNSSLGIGDEIILSGFQSEELKYSSPLWLTLNNGISKVENNSPFRVFNNKLNLENEVYDIIEHNKIIYLATSNGISYIINDTTQIAPIVKAIENTSDIQCWNFIKCNKNIFSSGFDILKITPHFQKFIPENQVIYLSNSKINTDIIYAGQQKGLSIYKNHK